MDLIIWSACHTGFPLSEDGSDEYIILIFLTDTQIWRFLSSTTLEFILRVCVPTQSVPEHIPRRCD